MTSDAIRSTPAEARRERTLVTPEGAALRLTIADASERATAFAIDVAIIALAAIAIFFICGSALTAAGRAEAAEFVLILGLLSFFALRTFYFMIFEMRPAAATPGKRLLGLRVVARDGGRLAGAAVFARNAMRELEIFMPLSFLASAGRSLDPWVATAGLLWTAVFVFFPLFNRDRLRAGDLIAGTWVVKSPKPLLLNDLTEQKIATSYAFTLEQIDVYGERELHVLEDVLRATDPGTMSAVADRIRRKIGWTPLRSETDFDFLNAYYKALRGRLESRLLLGRRRHSKHER
jgi:uncharacterized RDD family membrane protein YckC